MYTLHLSASVKLVTCPSTILDGGSIDQPATPSHDQQVVEAATTLQVTTRPRDHLVMATMTVPLASSSTITSDAMVIASTIVFRDPIVTSRYHSFKSVTANVASMVSPTIQLASDGEENLLAQSTLAQQSGAGEGSDIPRFVAMRMETSREALNFEIGVEPLPSTAGSLSPSGQSTLAVVLPAIPEDVRCVHDDSF